MGRWSGYRRILEGPGPGSGARPCASPTRVGISFVTARRQEARPAISVRLLGMVHFLREIGSHLGLPQKIGCLMPNVRAQCAAPLPCADRHVGAGRHVARSAQRGRFQPGSIGAQLKMSTNYEPSPTELLELRLFDGIVHQNPTTLAVGHIERAVLCHRNSHRQSEGALIEAVLSE